MKGMELPVNVLIILVISVIVLVAVIAILYNNTTGSKTFVDVGVARDNTCQQLLSMGCYLEPNAFQVHDFDANMDGSIDTSDTLMDLCINYFQITNPADCKAMCGC